MESVVQINALVQSGNYYPVERIAVRLLWMMRRVTPVQFSSKGTLTVLFLRNRATSRV